MTMKIRGLDPIDLKRAVALVKCARAYFPTTATKLTHVWFSGVPGSKSHMRVMCGDMDLAYWRTIPVESFASNGLTNFDLKIVDSLVSGCRPGSNNNGKIDVDPEALVFSEEDKKEFPQEHIFSRRGMKLAAPWDRAPGIDDLIAPEFPDDGQKVDLHVGGEGDAADFLALLKGTIGAASTEDARYYLNGIYIDTRKGEAAATDEHRLYVRSLTGTFDLPGTFPDGSKPGFILPRKSAKVLIKALGACRPDTKVQWQYVRTKTFAERVSFEFDGHRIVTKAVDGQYPRYEATYPVDPKCRVVLDRDAAVEVMNEVIALSSEKSVPVSMSVLAHDKIARFAAKSVALNIDYVRNLNAGESLGSGFGSPHKLLDGKRRDGYGRFVPAHDGMVGVNAKYLRDAILNVTHTMETVELSIVDDASPILIQSGARDMTKKASEAPFAIVMPMRV